MESEGLRMIRKEKTCPGFLLYYSDMGTLLNVLTAEECGRVLQAVYTYMRTGEEIELTGCGLACYCFLKERAVRYEAHYYETCERNRKNALKRAQGRNAASSEESIPETPVADAGLRKTATACDGSQHNRTEPNQTEPNQTEPNQTEPNRAKPDITKQTPAEAASSGSPGPTTAQQEAFSEFRKAYPKKHGLYQTLPLFLDALRSVSAERMLEVLKKQKRSHDWQKENGKYIPSADKWLRERYWEDEPEAEEDPYALPSMY